MSWVDWAQVSLQKDLGDWSYFYGRIKAACLPSYRGLQRFQQLFILLKKMSLFLDISKTTRYITNSLEE